MTNRAIHEFEIGLNGFEPDIFDFLGVFHALDVFVRAEFQVDGIGIVDNGLDVLRTEQFGQIAPYFITEGEFSIGKSARAGKPGSDVARRFAMHAFPGHALRAFTFVNQSSLIEDNDLFAAIVFQKFERRENSRGTGTDNQYVIHGNTSLSGQKSFLCCPRSSILPYLSKKHN